MTNMLRSDMERQLDKLRRIITALDVDMQDNNPDYSTLTAQGRMLQEETDNLLLLITERRGRDYSRPAVIVSHVEKVVADCAGGTAI